MKKFSSINACDDRGLGGPNDNEGHEHRATGDPSATMTMTAAAAVKMTTGITMTAAKMMIGIMTAGTTMKATCGIMTATVKMTTGKRKTMGNDDSGDDDNELDTHKPNDAME